MRVLLADRNTQVRWALHTVIAEEPGVTEISEVTEADNLLAKVQTLRPHLILLEWELPSQSTSSLLSALHALDPEAKVVILSRLSESKADALAAGADAFVSKADGPEWLLAAVRRLVREYDQSAVLHDRNRGRPDGSE